MKLRVALVFLLLLVLAGVLAGLQLRRTLYDDSPDLGEPIRIEVPAGASLGQTAGLLQQRGLISAAWQLRAVARIEGSDRSIQAGHYEIRPGLSPASVLRKLVAGEVVGVDVRLLEGWSAASMIEVLADSLNFDPEVLLQEVSDPGPDWRQRLDLPEGLGLEGYLFPETYRFSRGVGPESVLETLVAGLEAAWNDSMLARASELEMTRHEVLTLASIVEAEARLAEERSLVAAVYHNRLRRGMRLEADPTVAYATGVPGEKLRYRHLQDDSPYNTYRHAGLPPGPINSPGRAAILASLWPEEGFEALYFVSDGQGGHRFSRTWNEHVEAVKKYRVIQRQRRESAGGAP